MIEIVYTWPNGREEVRYRRPTHSREGEDLRQQVERLQETYAHECPYSYRYTDHE